MISFTNLVYIITRNLLDIIGMGAYIHKGAHKVSVLSQVYAVKSRDKKWLLAFCELKAT